jgi:hypothetical protein
LYRRTRVLAIRASGLLAELVHHRKRAARRDLEKRAAPFVVVIDHAGADVQHAFPVRLDERGVPDAAPVQGFDASHNPPKKPLPQQSQ